MDFSKEAFPRARFNRSATAQGFSDPPCVVIPGELLLALKKTPLGLATIRQFNRSCKENYWRNNKVMLSINITRDQLTEREDDSKKTTDHGRTYLLDSDDSPMKGVRIDLTLFDTGDRMIHWSEEERLSIIAIHEEKHLKYVKRNKTKYNVGTDECGGFWTRCHMAIFEHEFKARLEYSLLNSKVTPKAHWLDRYFQLFEVFDRFFSNPLDSEKKMIRKIKRAAKLKEADYLDVDLGDVLASKISYDDNLEFNQFKDAILAGGDFNNGKVTCLELYNEVINSFESGASRLDGKINYQILNIIKDIVKNKNKYLADKDFSFIP